MKSVPLLLAVSIAANAVLLACVAFRTSVPTPDAPPASASPPAAITAPSTAREPRLWSAFETDDLSTLVARLRAAGFPPATVRAIVTARIQARFTARMDALGRVIEETPFWRPTTSTATNPKFYEERNAIYREQAKLLRELLGDEYFAAAGNDATVEQRRQFGNLSKAKIEAVSRIVDDYAEMTGQVRAGTQGVQLREDREKIALLEREKRADLAALLTPQELEDYDMRTSSVGNRLRLAANVTNFTEDEFRAVFRIQQQFEVARNPSNSASSGDRTPQARETTAQMNAQIKEALGAARFADYTRASTREFEMIYKEARLQNLPVSVAVTAYSAQAAGIEESLRIFNDRVSADQKRAALKTLAQTVTDQLIATLGPIAGPAYVKSSEWLRALPNGMVITTDGNRMMSRSLPATIAAAPR